MNKEKRAWEMLVMSLNPIQKILLKNWLKLFKKEVIRWFKK